MKLLLTVALAWALLFTAESLSCHECVDTLCSNTTSVECPVESTICRTVTSVILNGTSVSATVSKNCSTLLSCFTPTDIETEWSVNLGYSRESHTQICCVTDNCNFQTLAVPNPLPNGKVCPACPSSADSLAGTCNTTVACVGVENSCFNGTTSLNAVRQGCISRNICSFQATIASLFDLSTTVTCGAPWSVRISAALLTAALTAHKVLF